jgi:hypothetical protein
MARASLDAAMDDGQVLVLARPENPRCTRAAPSAALIWCRRPPPAASGALDPAYLALDLVSPAVATLDLVQRLDLDLAPPARKR